MKNFQKFFEEADIKGNPGIPGEGDRRPNETPYIPSVERRAKQRLNLSDRDISRMTPMGMVPSQKQMELGRRMMKLFPAAVNFCDGKEVELSELATKIIYDIYKDIVDRYEIELDIKIVKPGGVKPFMDEASEMEQPVAMRNIRDEEVIKEIHKRKLANLIIQGEAKNTKHVLHTDEVKDGLNEIYGERVGKEFFELLDELTKVADQLDWIIPETAKAEMMEQMPDGMAGACRVDWKEKEDEEEDEEEEEEEYQEPEYQEDDEEYQEDDEPMENFSKTPILKARGVDFAMLLHEAVKGLFEILSLGGIPEDEDVATKVLGNTGMGDEPQDFKYGPEVAADLRDFVNKNEKIDSYPNIREELWKLMIDKETMPTGEFLELMRGILSGTEKARRDVDRLINQVIETIKLEKDEIDRYEREMDEYNRKMKDYNKAMDDFLGNLGKKSDTEDSDQMETGMEDDDEISKLIRKTQQPKEVAADDYASMSQKELQKIQDDAIDNGDYDTARAVSKYIKESISYKRRNFKK